MPKMQVYLPAELYERLKAHRDLNVSGILQEALERALDDIERRAALEAVVREHEAEHGAFTREEIEAQERADRAAALVSGRRRRKKSA